MQVVFLPYGAGRFTAAVILPTAEGREVHTSPCCTHVPLLRSVTAVVLPTAEGREVRPGLLVGRGWEERERIAGGSIHWSGGWGRKLAPARPGRGLGFAS